MLLRGEGICKYCGRRISVSSRESAMVCSRKACKKSRMIKRVKGDDG